MVKLSRPAHSRISYLDLQVTDTTEVLDIAVTFLTDAFLSAPETGVFLVLPEELNQLVLLSSIINAF